MRALTPWPGVPGSSCRGLLLLLQERRRQQAEEMKQAQRRHRQRACNPSAQPHHPRCNLKSATQWYAGGADASVSVISACCSQHVFHYCLILILAVISLFNTVFDLSFHAAIRPYAFHMSVFSLSMPSGSLDRKQALYLQQSPSVALPLSQSLSIFLLFLARSPPLKENLSAITSTGLPTGTSFVPSGTRIAATYPSS
jgi:hypothetical protein